MNLIRRVFGPRYPMLRRMVVNTRSGQAFQGVLWQRRGEYLLLRDAKLCKAGGATVPVAGEVVIPAANVDFFVVE